MHTTDAASTQNWEFQIHPETAGYLITRSTILILCGLLAGILLSFQLTISQRVIVASSCMVGIIAFLTVDGGINSRLLAHQRRIRETRDTLNRRIDLQLAFLDAQIREAAETGNPQKSAVGLAAAAAAIGSTSETA
ncbi:MAG: hypothetical protein JWM11_6952 [Planctomycetaceae bacterium]|nr:hypothetical protein [Planctomycetaceae bacterium]